MTKEKYSIKIICFTPPGKAKKAIKTFRLWFSKIQKPREEKVIDKNSFYLIYDFNKKAKLEHMINKSIPKAEMKIRSFYITLIHVVKKGNKLAKKGAWAVEKTKRWMIKRLGKTYANPKQFADFVDAISLEDEAQMMDFLSKDLINYEVL